MKLRLIALVVVCMTHRGSASRLRAAGFIVRPTHQHQRKLVPPARPSSEQDGDLVEEGPLPPPSSSRETPPRLLTRKALLENARAALGIGLVGVTRAPPLRGAAGRVIGAGVPAAACGLGSGLGQGGVRSAEAFGGPSRPLSRCLVNAVNAREFCKRLEADLAAGRNEQECRGMVKGVLRGLNLQESVKDAALYLPKGKRQAAGDAGQSAVEYLASVVEFDAWDKLDKDWTSNVALRNMTPENVMFVRMALDASGSALDTFLREFDRADVESARELYRMYFLPAEEREQSEA